MPLVLLLNMLLCKIATRLAVICDMKYINEHKNTHMEFSKNQQYCYIMNIVLSVFFIYSYSYKNF